MADNIKNFAYSTVAVAPSPATTGTELQVQAGEGQLFPTPPFNLTVWPSGVQPLSSNAEIVRVTNISTDTLTIVREEEDTTAISIAVGYQVSNTITKRSMQDRVDTAGDMLTGDLIGTDFVRTRSGTITRSNGFITAINLTGGRNITINRDGSNYITDLSDDMYTWVYSRDGNNDINSWDVDLTPRNYVKANIT